MDINASSDSSQWMQMRQGMMDSLRVELQNDLQSHVKQLTEKVALLEWEVKKGETEKSELKQRCDTLHHTNAMLLKRQLEGEEKISQLEEKLESLQTSFDRAEKKVKYLEVVNKNQQWEYPLDVPTIAELMSDGYSEEQSEEIIMKIDYIEDITTKMRKGEAIYCIRVDFYYEGMLPHYRQFENALVEYKHTIDYMEDKSFGFAIGGDTHLLTSQVLLLLEKALNHTHFHRMEFHRIQHEGERYLEFITNCARDNTRLEKLHLDSIAIENSGCIDLFCEALNNNGTLRQIELRFCGTEGGPLREIFNKLRTKNVHKIDLAWNRLSNLRPRDISEFLSSNPSLEELDLSNNSFNEQDIVYISDALRHNTTLRRLRLQFWFPDPPPNWYLLEYAMFDSTSLNAANYSNHHCHLILGINSKKLKYNTYDDPILNRRKKMYTLFSTRNRRRANTAFFEQDGIGIKHIPQILSLLKTFSEHSIETGGREKEDDEVNPLSITYEIMRDWRMPELYNFVLMDED